MKVKELIEFLQQHDPDMGVVYKCFSEYDLLEAWKIQTEKLCHPRPDGWVHDARPDRQTIEYLVFPGN